MVTPLVTAAASSSPASAGAAAAAPDAAPTVNWAPDWIPGVPWEPGTGIGSPNVNMTLFNFGGQALPSIGIFENPAGVCERANPGSAPCVVGG